MRLLFVLLTLTLLLPSTLSSKTESAEFFALKLKTLINLIFEQTTYAVINIPFFPNITLEKFKINDLTYSYTPKHTHYLQGKMTVKGIALGSQISNTFNLGVQFKEKNHKTIPISYEFQILDSNNNMMLSLMDGQIKGMLEKMVGKEIPFNIFPSFLGIEEKKKGKNHQINFDVSEYMADQKDMIEQVEKLIKKEKQTSVDTEEMEL